MDLTAIDQKIARQLGALARLARKRAEALGYALLPLAGYGEKIRVDQNADRLVAAIVATGATPEKSPDVARQLERVAGKLAARQADLAVAEADLLAVRGRIEAHLASEAVAEGHPAAERELRRLRQAEQDRTSTLEFHQAGLRQLEARQSDLADQAARDALARQRAEAVSLAKASMECRIRALALQGLADQLAVEWQALARAVEARNTTLAATGQAVYCLTRADRADEPRLRQFIAALKEG